MNNLILYLLTFYFLFCQEHMLFRTTEKYYCKKNKGNCEKCKAWSCEKAWQDKKNHCTK